ncbi:methyltransferase family protein [Patescibacteria group bacterium]
MSKKSDMLKFAVSGILKMTSFFVLIFLLAGRFDYWQGWVFFGIGMTAAFVILILFRDKRDLLKERMKPGPGMKSWDKVFFAFNILFYFGILILGPLDGGRFMLSPEIPTSIYIMGYITHAVGYVIILWAMWTNNFFSSVVRIQKDRGQKVIQNGPYQFVRHPGYIGAFLIAPSSAIILGSLWSLIPAVLWVIALIIRTALEDKTLQKELEGYKEYTKKVRYRLIPGIW